MNSIIINKEGDYKDETISSVPLGINNITIENDDNFDLRRNNISSIKPMLSSSDGKRVKIKPQLHRKVPSNTFSMMANPKKNISSNVSNVSNVSDVSD